MYVFLSFLGSFYFYSSKGRKPKESVKRKVLARVCGTKNAQ